MKIFGYLLIMFASTQAYLWVFGAIELETDGKTGFYCLMVCGEFITGLLAAKIVKGL